VARRRRRTLVRQIISQHQTATTGASWCRVRALHTLRVNHLELLANQDNRDLTKDCFRTTSDHCDPDEDLLSLFQLFRRLGLSAGDKLAPVPTLCTTRWGDRREGEIGGVPCLNPFHYCHKITIFSNEDTGDDDDVPPPPYSLNPQESSEKQPLTSGIFSEASSGISTKSVIKIQESPATGSTWCKLAYWEECNRVGPLVTVTKPWIGITNSCCKSSKSSKSRLTQSQSERSPANVAFVKKDGGEELPLVNLFSQNQRASESTKKVRDKIGKGIVLQRVDNEVWLFNIDQIPIFVNSPTLENTTTDGVSQQSRQTPSSPHDTAAPPFTVHKVLPGQTVKAFDFANSASGGGSDGQKDRVRRSNQFGPYDPYAVRVSFGKGWGCNYSRQDATNCPCWLEVLLVAPSPKKPPPVPELVTDAKEAQICDSNKTGGDR